MIDWMKSNDVENNHIKKNAQDREDWHHIGGLDLPEKAEHTRERTRKWYKLELSQVAQ